MKQLLTILLLAWAADADVIAQPDTEIYVFDLRKRDGSITLENPYNVTYQNPGYDNQPHFLPDGSMYYVSTDNGQTDIAQVEFPEGSWAWLTRTTIGSEYSPTPIPGSQDFSYIRLDTNGMQRLYRHSYESQKPEVLLEDVKVGYHCWLDDNTLAAFVLGEPPSLQLCYVKSQNCTPKRKNIGRSLHKIPDSKAISFIHKDSTPWQIMSYDLSIGTFSPIINTLPESEDMCWGPDGTIFMGSGSVLYKYHPGKDKDWVAVSDLSEFDLSGITRLAVSPDGGRIAIVVDQASGD
ncbi:hypothetical protein C900_03945 [Fulvivirga imtechensis AK7]|uniref:Uncharacterized protein n=1 Tax=Fulvivirga imtechensis AK7 TaxID=1237149 RepID=L8JN75_9BACT|nr:PD40 domain-containing protein [Fulvivirga imtechensis]ELR70260.1 hypothetical protein C900_03945 [Fulvivirga imtechensis AK7]